MNSLFLASLHIYPDWKPFLTKERIEQVIQIEKQIAKKESTPSNEKVLRFLELPLRNIQIVIIGQDPYPQPNAATGRAFEVGTLNSWNEPFRNISLKNILRALYKAYSGNILKYNTLKEKFDNEFPILSPQKIFKHWEKQGVLLLNTSFTCEPGFPGSHKKYWEEFTYSLLNFINQFNSEFIWFLWGNHALNATSHLNLKNKIVSQHPMMCYEGKNRENDFLYGKINCFKQHLNTINWTGFEINTEFKATRTLF